MMRTGIPVTLIVLGCVLGGTSMFLQENRETEVPAAELITSESSGENNCGAISLYLICRMSGRSKSLDEIKKLTKTSVAGTSMLDIKEAAEQLGFQVKGSKCSFSSLWDYLKDRGHYAILFFRSGHFDPAVQILDEKIRIIDTSQLEIKECSEEDLKNRGWDETALLLQKRQN